MNKDNSASRLAPREHIRAPPNSATAQLFRARRQHGQVGEVATLPSRCLARAICYLFRTRDTASPGQEGRKRSPSSDKRRAPSCAADWLLAAPPTTAARSRIELEPLDGTATPRRRHRNNSERNGLATIWNATNHRRGTGGPKQNLLSLKLYNSQYWEHTRPLRVYFPPKTGKTLTWPIITSLVWYRILVFKGVSVNRILTVFYRFLDTYWLDDNQEL